MNIVMFKLGLDFGLEFKTVIHIFNNLWAYFVSVKMVILYMYRSISKEMCKVFPKLLGFFGRLADLTLANFCTFCFKNKQFTFL